MRGYLVLFGDENNILPEYDAHEPGVSRVLINW